jgi:hypothetical protein
MFYFFTSQSAAAREVSPASFAFRFGIVPGCTSASGTNHIRILLQRLGGPARIEYQAVKGTSGASAEPI